MTNDLDNEAPKRINWFQVLNELKIGGWSLYKIEAEMGVAKSTLMGWKAGAEPRHADGEMLVALWQIVTGKARADVPKERRFQNAYHRN